MSATPPTPDPHDDATDAAIDALLDAALRPEPWPDDARGRTRGAVAAANRRLDTASTFRDGTSHRPAVLARIGVAAAWSLAALLAIGTVALVLNVGEPGTTSDPVPGGSVTQTPTDDDPALLALQDELDAWAQTARSGRDDGAWLDDQLELLDTQVALATTETLWSHEDGWGSIEVADLHRELDALADPVGLTF